MARPDNVSRDALQQVEPFMSPCFSFGEHGDKNHEKSDGKRMHTAYMNVSICVGCIGGENLYTCSLCTRLACNQRGQMQKPCAPRRSTTLQGACRLHVHLVQGRLTRLGFLVQKSPFSFSAGWLLGYQVGSAWAHFLSCFPADVQLKSASG